MKSEWIALLEVVSQLEKMPYVNRVGQPIFQKICYVMTELKVDAQFKFNQTAYGIFSEDVQEALSILANSNLIAEKQLGRMTVLQIGSEYENARKDYADVLNKYHKEIDKTIDLFSRIKNTEQAEEVTTVLYASRNLKADPTKATLSEQELFDYILQWKKQWNNAEKRIKLSSTIRNLQILNWLKLQYSSSLPEENF